MNGTLACVSDPADTVTVGVPFCFLVSRRRVCSDYGVIWSQRVSRQILQKTKHIRYGRVKFHFELRV